MRYASKVPTLEKAMNADAPTLGSIKRERGKPYTEGFIMAWLAYLNGMLNLRKPMTDEQIEYCAVTITDEFYALKISDLTLIVKKVTSGQYGEFYESISPAKVLTFFREYFEERCNLAEEQSIREHKDRGSDDTFNFSSNIERIITTNTQGFNKQ